MKEFIIANQATVLAIASALFSVLIHFAVGKAPRLVAALQAVSIDMPKFWAALTDTLPPPALPPAVVVQLRSVSATKTPVSGGDK